MFGMEILDVAIGIILIFFLFSLVSAAVREGIEGMIKSRAVHLERGIRELLDDEKGVKFAKYLYEHPLVFSLYRGEYIQRDRRRIGGVLPTYIPARNFAVAVLDLAMRGPVPHTAAAATDPYRVQRAGDAFTIAELRQAALRIDSPLVQRALLAAIDNARDDVERVQTNLESWFDTAMDSVSGAYKRRTQLYLFLIGLATTLTLNVNTITIANYLSHNKSAREALVNRGQQVVQDTMYQRLARDTSARAADVHARYGDLRSLELPIGWDHATPIPASGSSPLVRLSYWTRTIFGLFVTALAVTLGAPFWFDLLNKIMVIRSTVKPHEKSQEESSEDRQKPAPAVQTLIATPQAIAPPVAAAGPSPRSNVAETPPAAVAPPFFPQQWASDDPDEGIL
jgi:hypothetical protein